jgi:hypothetical protein
MRIILALSFIVFAAPAVAQEAQVPKAPPPAPERSAVAPPPQSVNPDQLGVSLDRIRIRFQRTGLLEPVFDADKLKLATYVDVVGKAPPLRLFGPDANLKKELTSRAVPFGGPTHRDMLQVMTPQEFRTPAMDITALIEWLSRQFDKEKKEE